MNYLEKTIINDALAYLRSGHGLYRGSADVIEKVIDDLTSERDKLQEVLELVCDDLAKIETIGNTELMEIDKRFGIL